MSGKAETLRAHLESGECCEEGGSGGEEARKALHSGSGLFASSIPKSRHKMSSEVRILWFDTHNASLIFVTRKETFSSSCCWPQIQAS
ncbi:hypothetical protein Mal48_18960 [Thalassoglobus polymorphus]|uniref:Uncharacterized protein n=1 Tax=Thalassoglobus polymorphus TaxID=2527994 RepID=A0A517QLY5_9PLAN|nr:hypothetical protein Mal48_18960 [Thalassoglobus polymorphus]